MQIRFSGSSKPISYTACSPGMQASSSDQPLTRTIQAACEDRLDTATHRAMRGANRSQEEIDEILSFSRRSGIAPRDVDTLREFSREHGLLIVIRNPKRTSRIWHGRYRAKPVNQGKIDPQILQKTNSAGVTATKSKELLVSDYDLMCVWRQGKRKLKPVFISAPKGASRGGWSKEAVHLIRELNHRLLSKIQHGCQDDYHSHHNPGIDINEDHFSVFSQGKMQYLANAAEAEKYYKDRGLRWLYKRKTGRYTGPIKTRPEREKLLGIEIIWPVRFVVDAVDHAWRGVHWTARLVDWPHFHFHPLHPDLVDGVRRGMSWTASHVLGVSLHPLHHNRELLPAEPGDGAAKDRSAV